METSELRISNVVTNNFNRIIKVVDVRQGGITGEYKGKQNTPKEGVRRRAFCSTDIEPIPLTEEILLKCGFKRDSDLKNSLCRFGIWFNIMNMEATYLSQKLIKINYLHQLQNLYFALTGEELEINM